MLESEALDALLRAVDRADDGLRVVISVALKRLQDAAPHDARLLTPEVVSCTKAAAAVSTATDPTSTAGSRRATPSAATPGGGATGSTTQSPRQRSPSPRRMQRPGAVASFPDPDGATVVESIAHLQTASTQPGVQQQSPLLTVLTSLSGHCATSWRLQRVAEQVRQDGCSDCGDGCCSLPGVCVRVCVWFPAEWCSPAAVWATSPLQRATSGYAGGCGGYRSAVHLQSDHHVNVRRRWCAW